MVNLLRNFFKAVLGNIKTIIMSLFISILIWLAVSLQLFPDVLGEIYDIPVQISPTEFMQDESLRLAENYDLSVSVQIKGKRYDIGRLKSEDFEAYLDLSDISADGMKEVPIVIVPNDNAKCEILPVSQSNTVMVNVEKIARKTLDVEVKPEGISVIEGLQVDVSNLKANPPTITITGEKKLVDSVTRAEVISTYDGILLDTTEVKGELALYNSGNVKINNPDLEMDNTYFTVTVPIHKVKTLPLNFKITNPPPNFDIASLQSKISIRPYELTISSPDNFIDSLTELTIGSMSLSDLTYQLMNSPMHFLVDRFLVEGYKNISNQSACMLQFVGIEDYTSFMFTVPSENFSVMNMPSNLEAEFLTKEITVSVVGPSWYVQALSVDDIAVTVNLFGSEITEGMKTLTATCRINGENVKAWVAEIPKIDILFTASNQETVNVQ